MPSRATAMPYETDLVAEIDGERYFVLTKTQAEGIGGRSWQYRMEPQQESKAQPLSIPQPSWHEGCGFSYAGVASVYETAGAPPSGTANGSGWDASSPGRLATWARHAVGTSVTVPTTKRGWLLQLGTSLYMLRGRYVTKYTFSATPGSTWAISGTDRDLGAGNGVAGRPVVWNGKIYVPSQVLGSTTLNTFTEITQGAPDTYVAGPAGKEAICFQKFKSLMARGQANGVATVATVPTTAANWSDDGGVGTYKVGDPGALITDLVAKDLYLFVAKEDGIWSFGTGSETTGFGDFSTRSELPSLDSVKVADNCSPINTYNDQILIPHQSGLIRWIPGDRWRYIGPEQEGALEGDITQGWGRCVGVIPYGPTTFVIYRDETNTKGAIVSIRPGRGGRDPIPQMHVQCTSGYFENGTIFTDSSTGISYLCVIHTTSDGLTAEPWVWRLPRAGMSVANDPGVPKAVHNTTIRTSRFYAPSRAIQKTYRELEFYAELTAADLSNTPGIQVWASVDEGAFVQMLDGSGAAATIKAEGDQRVFMPATSASVGHYIQFEFRIPATSGGQTTLAIDAIRDMVIRGSYRPRVGPVIETSIILGQGEFDDRTGMMLSNQAQRANIEALAGTNAAAIAYKDPWGGTGYCTVEAASFKEVTFKGLEESVWVAQITLRDEDYT